MPKRRSPSKADGRSSSDALEQALGALRHRERSEAEIDRYLAARGVADAERGEVIETLTRTSLVDDRRYAETRASSLAERGAGDALIRHELLNAGVDLGLADEVISVLPEELERAERVVARRGVSPRTARYLAGKGFSDEVVRAAVAESPGERLG